jgi:hypothetical protein
MMMPKALAPACLAALLAGCAAMPFGTERFIESAEVTVQMPDDVYRVRDRPAENRLIIASIGTSASRGFIQDLGQSFARMAFDTAKPTPQLQAAAQEFLRQSGRDCRILETNSITPPQFEVKYDCSPRPPLPNLDPAKPKRKAAAKQK